MNFEFMRLLSGPRLQDVRVPTVAVANVTSCYVTELPASRTELTTCDGHGRPGATPAAALILRSCDVLNDTFLDTFAEVVEVAVAEDRNRNV